MSQGTIQTIDVKKGAKANGNQFVNSFDEEYLEMDEENIHFYEIGEASEMPNGGDNGQNDNYQD